MSSLLASIVLGAMVSGQVRDHVDPQMVIRAPGAGSDSEAGIGALIAWADSLWAVGYVAHIRGEGLGLYQVTSDMEWVKRPESVTGTYANRYIHWASKQAVIGPHVISEDGTVRTISALSGHRLTATAAHLTKRDHVYFLTMEGLLFETDMATLESTQLFDLTKELDWTSGAYLHFKGMHTGHGRVVVANNTYEEGEHLGTRQGGRLAEWTGEGDWTILERNPFIEVSGNQRSAASDYYGSPLYAVGWDRRSVILRVMHRGQWTRYRLPFGSASWMHTWNTEWMRIRFAQTERHLMDAFGIFYDLPNLVYGGRLMPPRPIATHLRIVPDFTHFNGYFVMGGDQTDHTTGQPQSGLWWGSIDDLWGFGKATGWGSLWREDSVAEGEVSDPFLIGGFDEKSVHLLSEPGEDVAVALEVDPTGDGDWRVVAEMQSGDSGYGTMVFPEGFSAHWLRGRVIRGGSNVSLTIHYN